MNLLRWFFQLVLVLVLVLVGISAHAEVYRWVDSAGRVHFGDRLVSGQPRAAEKVEIRTPNLAKSYEGTQDAPVVSGSAPAGSDPAPQASSPVAASSTVPRGGVVASQTSCNAKKAAYAASKACFDACGRSNGFLGGRNNAGCEPCNDLPRPSC